MKLERVLEPEVMDTAEEADGYNSMDHAEVNKLFVADLLEFSTEFNDVLDLGTGTALIPIELCEQHAECRVMAVDMAVSMLDLARYNIEVNQQTERIELAQVDAKKLSFDDDMFDAVISNSIVHHIPEPRACLEEAIRVTKPGGILFFRDLLRPETGDDVQRLVELYAGDEDDFQKKMFDDSLRAALSLEEIRELIASFEMDPDAVVATSDRHWTWAGRK